MTWMLELPIAYGLGWALIHFLWQGALIALLLAAILPVLRVPRTRYVAACGAMTAMVAAFVATWVLGNASLDRIVEPSTNLRK